MSELHVPTKLSSCHCVCLCVLLDFPVGGEIREIVIDWVTYLRREKLWGNDDPLFPSTRVSLDAARQFEANGLKREQWSSAAPIRIIFRDAFKAVDLPYFNPHSFRNTLAQLGETICRTPEEFKARSQNLGHQGVLTTFYSYGEVAGRRQGEIIRNLALPHDDDRTNVTAIARAVARELRGSA